MDKNLVLVFDCGATNVRAVAINTLGEIEAIHTLPNKAHPDPEFQGGLIWDVDEIWNKFVYAAKSIKKKIDVNRICGITVTTFGVNGAPVDKKGELLYPVISWQCQRTVPIMENIGKYIPLEELYQINGVNAFSFNTINVLIWLKENRPEVFDKMEGWLFMPSLFINRLTGKFVNDYTMAGTSMLTDLGSRSISDSILKSAGLDDKFFEFKEAGSIVGELQKDVAFELGLTEGIPVVLTGHDTQFALIGSGAGENEAVLSSGTWEILMTRSKHFDSGVHSLNAGLTHEFDAIPNLYNTGSQWLASGVLEWIKNIFYYDCLNKKTNIYELMIGEAEEFSDTGSIQFVPDFIQNQGVISGLGLQSQRGQIYRAALESFAVKTKEKLAILQKAGKFEAKSLILVGGGSKNRLWNQLRAIELGIPVKIAKQTETTVLGASLFVHAAIGNFNSVEEAALQICHNYRVVEPE